MWHHFEQLRATITEMKKVFVVDERFSVLQLLYRWFLSKGFEVRAFSKSVPLCEAISESVPDIIVMNADMMCENGERLCVYLKRRFCGGFPMILFSAVSARFKKMERKKPNAGLLPQGFVAL